MSEVDLTEKARLARNAYQREYRAKNKGKIKEINARYWERKAAQEAKSEQTESDE